VLAAATTATGAANLIPATRPKPTIFVCVCVRGENIGNGGKEKKEEQEQTGGEKIYMCVYVCPFLLFCLLISINIIYYPI